MTYRILHISDVHTGPPFRAHVAEALARQAHTLQPDLLVISGDFVQRADFTDQWHAAQALREALPQPQLVVPGNHDVPLFHTHLRLFNPLGRYRRYISAELNQRFEQPGLVVVGVCTAHGLTVDGGRLSRSQVAALRQALSGYGPEVYKIVVWHHPLLDLPGAKRSRMLRHASRAARLLDSLGVDLLLCGHAHSSAIATTRDLVGDLRRGTITCQSGTSTSSRGHGREHGKNACNLIELEPEQLRISQMVYQEASACFERSAVYTFPRSATPVAQV